MPKSIEYTIALYNHMEGMNSDGRLSGPPDPNLRGPSIESSRDDGMAKGIIESGLSSRADACGAMVGSSSVVGEGVLILSDNEIVKTPIAGRIMSFKRTPSIVHSMSKGTSNGNRGVVRDAESTD